MPPERVKLWFSEMRFIVSPWKMKLTLNKTGEVQSVPKHTHTHTHTFFASFEF
jgi:hypothetical protein